MGILCFEYDAYYDIGNNWIEDKCGNSECYYCGNHPETHPNDCESCKKEYKH